MYLRMYMALVAVCLASITQATTLEVPSSNTTVSGIGVISGWKCAAEGDITIRLNGGDPFPATYGLPRSDTSSVCGDDGNNGFFSYWNWGNLGDGEHTVVAYDSGKEFARSTFRVVTTGEEFLRGASGTCEIPDFPAPGETARFKWNQSTQHLELDAVIPPARPGFERIWGTWRFGSRIGTFTWRPLRIEDTYAHGNSDSPSVSEPTALVIIRYPDASDPPPVADYEYVASWWDSSFCYQYAFSFTDTYTTEGEVWRQGRVDSSCPKPFSGSRYDVSAYR